MKPLCLTVTPTKLMIGSTGLWYHHVLTDPQDHRLVPPALARSLPTEVLHHQEPRGFPPKSPFSATVIKGKGWAFWSLHHQGWITAPHWPHTWAGTPLRSQATSQGKIIPWRTLVLGQTHRFFLYSQFNGFLENFRAEFLKVKDVCLSTNQISTELCVPIFSTGEKH